MNLKMRRQEEQKNNAESYNPSGRMGNTIIRIFIVMGIVLAVIGFVALGLSGGGPEIINGNYYVADHGEIITALNYDTYRILKICECALSGGVVLIFSSVACYVLNGGA